MIHRPADAPPLHGGDLAFAEATYGVPREGWLDLSTGINPHLYPAPPIETDSLARLPEPSALRALIALVRDFYGVPAEAGCAALPGSDLAIRLLPLVAPGGRAVIVGPTYSGYGEAFSAAGRSASEVGSIEAVPADARIVVLANPNNPDGRIFAPERLSAVAETLAGRAGLLVVDEAFADLAPEISAARLTARLPILVLRSFGKFHGLAGLRLGFAAGPNDILSRLNNLLGAWPLSGPAIAIGRAALADPVWHEAMRRRLAVEAKAFRSVIARHGLKLVGGTDLFALVSRGDAGALHAALARRGVWTRAFASRPDWLRIGLAAPGPALDRLDRALKESLAEIS